MTKKKAIDIQILRSIYEYVEAKGYPPTMRELCTLCGIESTSTVSARLSRLEGAGFIMREPVKTRAMRLTELGRDLLAARVKPA